MRPLRIALTISGAVSLGAYEAGAIAALLVAVQRLQQEPDPPVRVDVIAGSSAGAITGLLATRVLLHRLDPVATLRAAWVDAPQIDDLLGAGNGAPLSLDRLRDRAVDLLDPPEGPKVERAQREPVHLHITLATLRGLRCDVATTPDPDRSLALLTYEDWDQYRFEPGDGVEDYVRPSKSSALDAAIASAANPYGFAPVLLNRRVRARRRIDDSYEERNVLLDVDELWCIDGGTVDNRPIGHTIDLVKRVDVDLPRDDRRRLVLIVHPNAEEPTPGPAWSGAHRPSWYAALRRAKVPHESQSLHEDLRRALAVNEQVAAIDQLRDRTPSDAGVDEVEAAAGLADKRVVSIEEIGPTAVASATPSPDGLPVTVDDILRGERLRRFGGFLSPENRSNDFDVGYLSTTRWLAEQTWLSPRHVEAALVAVERAHDAQEPTVERGRLRLGPRGVVALARVGARMAVAVLAGARRSR